MKNYVPYDIEEKISLLKKNTQWSGWKIPMQENTLIEGEAAYLYWFFFIVKHGGESFLSAYNKAAVVPKDSDTATKGYILRQAFHEGIEELRQIIEKGVDEKGVYKEPFLEFIPSSNIKNDELLPYDLNTV